MKYLKLLWRWVVKSSADPEKMSLTIKGLLVLLIPYILTSLDMVCAIGQYCISVDESFLKDTVDFIGQSAYLILSFVGAAMTFWGAIRKVDLTVRGENKTLR